jgi:hypothetical protein
VAFDFVLFPRSIIAAAVRPFIMPLAMFFAERIIAYIRRFVGPELFAFPVL